MDKQQAKHIIKETFENSFEKERFIGFIKNLLKHIEEDRIPQRQGQFIPEAYRQYISTLERIGKFNDGENRIDILIIKLQKETSIERARTMQRNFVAGYLQGKYGSTSEKEAALVAFVSPDEEDWRFSLVKMDYKFEQSKSGRVKVKEEFTPARRWSFLVGKNETSHTAQSRLVNILANDEHSPTLAELEHAFDIETVTKEFFIKYRELFIRTKEELDKIVTQAPSVTQASSLSLKNELESKGVDTVNFAKKLLGQIVFLYFLQKKGWFGVGRDDDWGAGSKHFLRELFEKKVTQASLSACDHAQEGSLSPEILTGFQTLSGLRPGAGSLSKESKDNHKQDVCDTINFFNDILEPLFYEALRNDRSHDDHYYSRFNCKIPFLNGGLFDPIGNYDWVHTDIHLPDSLFSNTVRTKEGDEGNGILDIFDRYNFTVREDEPLEKEVAIDPELLGKAYEKFNAIRPDNFEEYKKALKSGKKGEENKFNKQYGVYYTPREIVHYMCQQSLINYLFTECNTPSPLMGEGEGVILNEVKNLSLSKEDIETLIHLGEQVSENEATALLKEKLIAEGKQKTTKNKPVLPDSIKNNAALLDNKLEEITVCDPAVGSGAFPVGMMSEIVKARKVLSVFLNNKDLSACNAQTGSLSPETLTGLMPDTHRTAYDFKRHCIEHSLYGVDIDPGAVEIAKLRLWLSLVVDEDDIKNIKPLPNLDYRIMQGNSLISELMGINFDSDSKEKNGMLNFKDKTDELIEQFQQKKDQFLNESNISGKTSLKEEVDDLLIKIFETKLKIEKQDYFNRLKNIENKYSPLPNEKQREEYIKQDKEKLYKEYGFNLESAEIQLKEFTSGNKIRPFFLWKLYFSEVFHKRGGFDIVIANPPYGISITKKENQQMASEYKIILKGEIETYILFYFKGLCLLHKNGYLSYITPDSWFTNRGASLFREWLTKNHSIVDVFDWYKPFAEAKDTRVHTVLLESSKLNLNIRVKQVLPSDPKTIYRKYEIPHSIISDFSNKEWRFYLTNVERKIFNKMEGISQPLERLYSIKYGLRTGNNSEYITEKETKYPLIAGADIASLYEVNWKPKYLKKIKGLPKGYFKEYFSDKKIIIQYVRTNSLKVNARWLEAAYIKGNFIPLNSLSYIYQKSVNYKLKYLLGIINSFLMNRYYRAYYTDVNVKPTYLAQLPIPNKENETSRNISSLVNEILSLTQSDAYLHNKQKQYTVKTLKAKIDQLVYKLYGLTPEEIKIVEGKGKSQ